MLMELQLLMNLLLYVSSLIVNAMENLLLVIWVLLSVGFAAVLMYCITTRNPVNGALHHRLNAFKDLLTAASENDVITCVSLMKEHPELINQPHSVDGYTPFMRACLNGYTQLVKVMLTFGADLSSTSANGETPFYLAVFNLIKDRKRKDASCIHALFYAGADINASNHRGLTPLHMAVMFGHTQLVIWLLNKGACSALQPDPYVLARREGHLDTARVLKERIVPAIE